MRIFEQDNVLISKEITIMWVILSCSRGSHLFSNAGHRWHKIELSVDVPLFRVNFFQLFLQLSLQLFLCLNRLSSLFLSLLHQLDVLVADFLQFAASEHVFDNTSHKCALAQNDGAGEKDNHTITKEDSLVKIKSRI